MWNMLKVKNMKYGANRISYSEYFFYFSSIINGLNEHKRIIKQTNAAD